MAPTKLIKFCGFTVHSKPYNVTLSAFPEKIPEIEKKNLTFLCDRRLTECLTQLTNLIQFRYLGPLANISITFFFILDLLLKLRVLHIRKKLKIYFSSFRYFFRENSLVSHYWVSNVLLIHKI